MTERVWDDVKKKLVGHYATVYIFFKKTVCGNGQ